MNVCLNQYPFVFLPERNGVESPVAVCKTIMWILNLLGMTFSREGIGNF